MSQWLPAHQSPCRRLAILFAFVCSLALVPSLTAGQAVVGALLGNVSDTSGAAIPGVTVTITEVNTNLSRTAVTSKRSCRGSRSTCARASRWP
jgi:hypothetical protein